MIYAQYVLNLLNQKTKSYYHVLMFFINSVYQFLKNTVKNNNVLFAEKMIIKKKFMIKALLNYKLIVLY